MEETKEKAEENLGLPETFRMAEDREPNIFRVVVEGKSYIDVTDLWIPY